MKICFVHEEYPKETNFGGIATYQKIMAEYYAKTGDYVTVIARGKKDINYIENGVHVYRVASLNDSNDINSVKEYRRKVAVLLENLQEQGKIELIETPDWGANTIYFEENRHIPLVARLHTPLKIWLQYNNNDFGESKNLILKWENKMLQNADLITSCSELLKQMVQNQYNLKKDIITIPNPYNEKNFFSKVTQENNDIIFVGSLEERKGVLILAEALNQIMNQIPNNKIYFIGKDTTRNNKNISTKEYILNIIDKKFHDRLIFVGQIQNEEINSYLNKVKLAIFPSVFDNFPYVVLEAMTAGKHIICSDNMGVVDLLKENNAIFKSGDVEDLKRHILEFFRNQKPFLNEKNIEIVNTTCNQELICEEMRKYYKQAIKQYQQKKNIEKVFHRIIKEENIKKIVPMKEVLANDVYQVITNKNKYIVKKYNYHYDFNLSSKLCDFYEKAKINVVRPIGSIIEENNDQYHIFPYLTHHKKNVADDFFQTLLTCNRKTNLPCTLLEKCTTYYQYLSKQKKLKLEEQEKKIIKLYQEISKENFIKETYLNHGDLSKNNILFHQNEYYVIDFDEASVTTKFYDFAVMMVKNKVKNQKIDKKSFNFWTKKLNLSKEEAKKVLQFYLCKILLEKFYLYEKGIIDLYSEEQKRDFYEKYLSLLTSIEEL